MTTSAELAAMKTGATTLDDLGSQMNATLNQLRTDVEMTQSAWVGAAQIAFRTVMARWDENGTKINTALHDISGMLAGNTSDYGHTEQANADDLTRIAGASVLQL